MEAILNSIIITGNVEIILEKSGKSICEKKWEPCTWWIVETTTMAYVVLMGKKLLRVLAPILLKLPIHIWPVWQASPFLTSAEPLLGVPLTSLPNTTVWT